MLLKLSFLKTWKHCFTENEAEMLKLLWQTFEEDVNRLRDSHVRVAF